MAYTAKEYQGAAAGTTLNGAITNASSSLTAVSATAYPTGSGGNFVIVLDRGTSAEEKVLCSSRTSNTFTVAASGRGYDGTTAVAHVSGAALEHCLSAVDMSEANTAVVNTVGRVTSLGDLLVGSGPNAMTRLAVGTAGQVATVSGGTVAWAALPAAALAYAQSVLSADVPLTAATPTSIVTVSLTAGTWMLLGSATVSGATNPVSFWLQRMDTNVGLGIGAEASTSGSGYGYAAVPAAVVVLAGTTTVALMASSLGSADTVVHTPRAGGNMPNTTGIVAVKIA